jgi:hypothetical protein
MAQSLAILVLGAGELGMAVLRGLARRTAASPGVTLTVLLRPQSITSEEPAKQRDLAELRSLGITLLAGDLLNASVEDLAQSFRPFHTVIGCTGFVAGPNIQMKITRAALAAGVRRYVPWQFGIDYDVIGRGSAQDLFDEQLDVRDLVRAQQASGWLIISTGMFTSFLFEPSFGVVDLGQGSIHALGTWETAVTVTTSEDIGNLTAEILFTKPSLMNQVVYTGGDTITYARLAGTVDSVLGRKLHRAVWSVPQLREELARDPGNSLRKYRVAFAEGKGVAWDMAKTFNAERRIPVTDVEHWLRNAVKRGLTP